MKATNETSTHRMPPLSLVVALYALSALVAGGAAEAQTQNPCSCYYDFECKATGRGDYCSYVGDCQGGSGCGCIIKPDVRLATVPPFDQQFPNGVLVCAGPANQPKCDGVCRSQRAAEASYENVKPEKVAQIVDLILEGYLVAGSMNGGPPVRELIDDARALSVDLPVAWQKEILAAVHDFLFVILGGDVIPPFGEATFAQIPRLSAEQLLLFETVKDAFVEAIRTGSPDLVRAPILDFWSANEFEPLHPDHCFPHGHEQAQSVEECMAGQLTGLLTVLVRDQACDPGSPDCGNPPACDPETQECGGDTGATPCDPATQICGGGGPARDRHPGIESRKSAGHSSIEGRRSRRIPSTRDPGGRSRDGL